MSDTMTLPFPARTSDPQTSQQAAAIPRGGLREAVRTVLVAWGDIGCTDWELTDALGLDPVQKPTVGKRRQECGAVDTGMRRLSPSGSPCVAWTLP